MSTRIRENTKNCKILLGNNGIRYPLHSQPAPRSTAVTRCSWLGVGFSKSRLRRLRIRAAELGRRRRGKISCAVRVCEWSSRRSAEKRLDAQKRGPPLHGLARRTFKSRISIDSILMTPGFTLESENPTHRLPPRQVTRKMRCIGGISVQLEERLPTPFASATAGPLLAGKLEGVQKNGPRSP